MIIEACVNSSISAIEAQKGGADRVELCENLHDGGTTPSAGDIRFARKKLHIGLFVMILTLFSLAHLCNCPFRLA